MTAAPRIKGERRPYGILRVGLDGVHHPAVAERPAEHNEALLDEAVHERRVRRPAGLLLEWLGSVELRPGLAQDDVKHRHTQAF